MDSAGERGVILRYQDELRIVEWAASIGANSDSQDLRVDLGERSTRMAHSNATGVGLISNGMLGVDLIRIEAGDGFLPHTHPGDHLLIVVGGVGTITYSGYIWETRAGQVYMIDGKVPHAVGAITNHVILAVGSPHKPIDSTERMSPVEYQSVTADFGDLHCLICDKKVRYPKTLHDAGCNHCPCAECNSVTK